MALVLHTVMDVLTSPSARRIDFHLGLMHVDAAGLAAIYALIVAGSVRIDVATHFQKGVEAEYDNGTNTLRFPRADYGATSGQKAVILHECVHALHDVYGAGHFHPRGGSRFMTESENEAVAYVAGCLYHLYEAGRPLTGKTTTIFVYANKIAERIKNKRGAFVSTDETIELRKAIVDDPAYKIGFKTPTRANGL